MRNQSSTLATEVRQASGRCGSIRKRQGRRKCHQTREGCCLLGGAQREEVLRALDRLLQAAQKLLKVGVALDEIDFRGIDYEQVRRGVAEEEMVVGADDFVKVSARDLPFGGRFFLRDAIAQDFGSGLEIDHQIGRFQGRRKDFKVTVVKLQLFVVKIDVGEDLVFLE